MVAWDQSRDFVIVGSGGGGLVAALTAADLGLDAIVLEKQSLLGGSTAMSGGVVWLPNNPVMQAEGADDSNANGLAYLQDVVGDIGQASSPERRETFLTAGAAMINLLQRSGVHLIVSEGCYDYYSNFKSSNGQVRSLEPTPFDARQLGEWHDKIQPGLSTPIGLALLTSELKKIQYFNRTPGAFTLAARVWLRTKVARLRRQELLTNGAALVGQLLQALLNTRVAIWNNAAFDELIVEDGAVVGVRALRNGSPVLIEGRKGVLLAAGGFGHNAAMRRKYSGDQPNEAQWCVANRGDTGEALDAAIQIGARTDLMDEAWWVPGASMSLGFNTLAQARNRPGTIFVNSAGKRFCNESNSYVEVGKAMYANDAVPAWLIFDDRYRRRYVQTGRRPGRMPREWLSGGLVKRADTIEELATAIGVDPAGLAATIQWFNVNAAEGIDPEFGRGQSAYNRGLGDPANKPNPALGPIDRAPFYATQIFPNDVGTCGGLVTNEYAQVLDEEGSPIPGLYATGNTTATLMGRTYPGAGASIANSMVFGYVASQHAAAVNKATPGHSSVVIDAQQ